MRRVAQPPAHYEVELRQAGDGDAWRAVRRVWSCGTSPTKFGSVEAARAYAGRLRLTSARVVLVERDGQRRVVGAGEA